MAKPAPMPTQIPIYVINMARDEARMASMSAQLTAQGLAFERVEAVVGRELSATQRKAQYSDFWFRVFHGRSATPNELGCTLSHRKAWQMMLDRGQDWAVFFEDDASIDAEFAHSLHEYRDSTLGYDVAQFHSFRVPDIPDINASVLGDREFAIMKFSGPNASAIAYALRISGVEKLLGHRRVIMNADKWVWARALWGLKVCAIYPFPVSPHTTHSALSTIGNLNGGSRTSNLFWRIALLPVLRVVRTAILKLRKV